MNTNTKDKLIEFIHQVQNLAAGSVHMIGVTTAAEIMQAAVNLEIALNKDETILQ